MDLSASELSIYDKLLETINLVRQTGHQCGMSEKAIEKFVKQLLEKNEPQREPPRHFLLMIAHKGLITLGLILLAAYFAIQLYSPLPTETALSGAQSWGSLIRHIRLLSLPIAKKYMLERCRDWWLLDCRPNGSSVPANCSGCASVTGLRVLTDMGHLPEKLERLQPLLIKTGRALTSEELERFHCRYPELTEVIDEGGPGSWRGCFAHQSFPFASPRRKPLNGINRTSILHELFPIFTFLPFPKDISELTCFLGHPSAKVGSKTHRLHDVFVVGSGHVTLNITPSVECREHCRTLTRELEPGDVATPCWPLSSGSVFGSSPRVVQNKEGESRCPRERLRGIAGNGTGEEGKDRGRAENDLNPDASSGLKSGKRLGEIPVTQKAGAVPGRT
ncbi:bombesin receptor-activated protein C6orf89 homolog isoform X1 [Ornithorhynchus anatinus]|uniref:Bombesin receptor activated protein n=1 Tax=Ornithorhynchus anatinus TaxID=9258 RepID=A0A6I8NU61_ORNAN|nr:bombesin receptor-activated protein C6orf89 homolog isoform X1 [Ornithorhynchus anatinus]XP_028925591.1 bombesin receptor-activated protein C6orf89 homolog isoform X1 [Ornithorhynchus anatinus]XP_028925592.1 bombesin receptor-activated protein C6orf89 homolog isoform X1 [Ornithorhynchus anatinus]XP_028925593.1 bombesin receptor-activated protein C6orf89 homolog isoform X1 [Ornithorhynchus anatinus]